MTDADCARLRELGAELVLGVLPGDQRAWALDHVNRCPTCRENLRELTAIEDGLLALVPGAEPPIGFEDRVLAGLGITGEHRPRRRRGWLPLATVAAAIALVFGVAGWVIGGSTGPAPAASYASHLVRAELVTANHQPVGRVFVYRDSDSWMYLSVDVGRYNGPISCELSRVGGAPVSAGWFDLTDGQGYWGARLPVPAAGLTGVSLHTDIGTVLATAALPR